MEVSKLMNEAMYYNFRKKRKIEPSGLEWETYVSRQSQAGARPVIRKTCRFT